MECTNGQIPQQIQNQLKVLDMIAQTNLYLKISCKCILKVFLMPGSVYFLNTVFVHTEECTFKGTCMRLFCFKLVWPEGPI
jgi:hypothetical protein